MLSASGQVSCNFSEQLPASDLSGFDVLKYMKQKRAKGKALHGGAGTRRVHPPRGGTDFATGKMFPNASFPRRALSLLRADGRVALQSYGAGCDLGLGGAFFP